MEVHHHSHTSRKKWTHYFWEFLMLFLAVFCGFMAENQREHFVEHQREKKFMQTLYEDLKQDTSDLINDTAWWGFAITRIDTIRMEIEKPEIERNLVLMYYRAGGMRSYNSFAYHDRTIQQLKNGGNFRLVRNKAIADSLNDYDAYILTGLKDQEAQSNAIYQQVNFIQDKIFNSKYFHLISGQPISNLDDAFRNDPKVFGLSLASKTDLMQYYNHLEYFRRMSVYRTRSMKTLCRKAVTLLKLLEEEYHLK